jgi:hypothetical protein
MKVTALVGTTALWLEAAPEIFWQWVQWQAMTLWGAWLTS